MRAYLVVLLLIGTTVTGGEVTFPIDCWHNGPCAKLDSNWVYDFSKTPLYRCTPNDPSMVTTTDWELVPMFFGTATQTSCAFTEKIPASAKPSRIFVRLYAIAQRMDGIMDFTGWNPTPSYTVGLRLNGTLIGSRSMSNADSGCDQVVYYGRPCTSAFSSYVFDIPAPEGGFESYSTTSANEVTFDIQQTRFAFPSGVVSYESNLDGHDRGLAIEKAEVTLFYSDAPEKFVVAVKPLPQPGSSEESAQLSAGGTLKLRLTIGVPIDLTVTTQNNEPVLPEVVITQQAPEQGIDINASFFPNEVVHRFVSNDGTTVTLAPVHLGTMTGTLLLSGKSTKVEIAVVAPTKIGTKAPEVDPLLIDAGHKRGIPPHWIKAQIQGESDNWNPMSWRYEPFSFDLQSVSSDWPSHKEQPLREQIPYSRYRLATGPDDGNLSQHVALTHEDIAPRQSLSVLVKGQLTKIDSSMVCPDHCVTARAIVDGSDANENWSDDKNNGKTFDAVQKEWEAADKNPLKDPLRFTAQTTIASSYGLMQVMYTTAIKPMRWKDWHKDQGETPLNPRFLFDTAENIAKGDGSIGLGTAYTLRNYAFSASKGSEMLTSSWKDFEEAYRVALAAYNAGYSSTINGEPVNYAGYVFSFLPANVPELVLPIIEEAN